MNKIKDIMKNKDNYFRYGLLFLLLVITIVFCLIPNDGDAKTEVQTKQVDLYKLAFDKLINGNYDYTYKELNTKKNVLKIYTGSYVNEEDTGYYESNKEVFKYTCRTDKCYKVYTDHETEFEFKTSSYLKPYYIHEIISNLKEEIKEDDESKIYIYSNEDETVEIKITLVVDDITNIIIKDAEYEYNLSYY